MDELALYFLGETDEQIAKAISNSGRDEVLEEMLGSVEGLRECLDQTIQVESDEVGGFGDFYSLFKHFILFCLF